MDASWNSISNDPTVLQGIADNLGYSSVDDLPPVSSLNADQVATLIVEFSNQVGDQIVNQTGGDYNNPELDEADVPTDARSLGLSLQEATAKISNLLMQFAQETAKSDQDDIKSKQDKRIKELEKSLKKMKQAAKSGKASKILGWVGAVVGVIGAVAAVALTGGAAAPVLAVALIGLGLQIAQETGGMDKLQQAMFGDDDKAKMWFSIGLSVAMLIAGLATGYGAARAASSISDISRATQAIATAMNVTAEAVQTTAQATAMTAALIGALVSIGNGATQIDTAVTSYSATEDQQSAQKLKAWLAKLQAHLQETQADMKKIMDRYTNIGVKLSNELLDSGNEAFANVVQSDPA